jgi:excisionase family DNA binding protein
MAERPATDLGDGCPNAVDSVRRVPRPLTELQMSLLRRISDGAPFDDITYTHRQSARHVHHRGLIKIKGRGATWNAVLTELGEYYLEHGSYPAPVVPEPPSEPAAESTDDRRGTRRRAQRRKPATPSARTEWEVNSPRGKREAGGLPEGDDLFTKEDPDPWDQKILVTAKEAAWMLSVPTETIRRAATAGDLDRVFIGEGATHYRIVYESLLAWVNSMPRESSSQRRWR